LLPIVCLIQVKLEGRSPQDIALDHHPIGASVQRPHGLPQVHTNISPRLRCFYLGGFIRKIKHRLNVKIVKRNPKAEGLGE